MLGPSVRNPGYATAPIRVAYSPAWKPVLHMVME